VDGPLSPVGTPLTVAFLGPEGTYTHQAAVDRFGSNVVYDPRGSIADVFESMDGHSSLGCVPIENSLHGAVIETLDRLRSPAVGTSIHIRDEFGIPISHSLLVRKGTRIDRVRTVYSHEQALGQCARFLEKYISSAKVVKTSSTAAAAKLVAGDSSGESAAIGSRLCADLYPALEVLSEGIQGDANNSTRFLILATHPTSSLPCATNPAPLVNLNRTWHAIIRIDPPSTGVGTANLMNILGAVKSWSAYRIDRRPSLTRHPFHDVYFLSVKSPTACAREEWLDTLRDGVNLIRQIFTDGRALLSVPSDSDCQLLGSW